VKVFIVCLLWGMGASLGSYLTGQTLHEIFNMGFGMFSGSMIMYYFNPLKGE